MILPIVVAFTLHLPATRADDDRWLAPDKVKHFFTAGFVQSVAFASLRSVRVGQGAALLGASAITAGVSVGKEIWDAHGHGTPSARDLTWDVAGAGAATLLLERTAK